MCFFKKKLYASNQNRKARKSDILVLQVSLEIPQIQEIFEKLNLTR